MRSAVKHYPKMFLFSLVAACGWLLPTKMVAQNTQTDSTADLDSEAKQTIFNTESVEVTAPGEFRDVQELKTTALSEQTAGTSPIKSLGQLPSVNFQSADPNGSYEWAVRISVRGFNQNQLGFTLDDIPLGDMSYGNWNGLHISRAIIDENVGRIALSQGTGALETASNSNLGGTMQFYSAAPSDQHSLTVSQSFGSFNSNRTYGRYESGLIGGKTKFTLSGVDNRVNKWRGNGDIGQNYWQFNSKLVHLFNKGVLTAFLNTSERHEVDYQDNSKDWAPASKLGYSWDNYGIWSTAVTAGVASYNAYAASAAAYLAANPGATQAKAWSKAGCGVSGTSASAYGFTGAAGKLDSSEDPCDAAYYGGSGLRRDILGAVSYKTALTSKLTWKSTIYGHGNDGVGLWFMPSIEAGAAVYTAMLAETGSPIFMRSSEYGIQRGGFLTSLSYESSRNKIEGGAWFEKENFTLARRFYASSAFGPEHSLYSFPKDHFYTQWAYKFDINNFQLHLQDAYKVNDKLSVAAGFKVEENYLDGKITAFDTPVLQGTSLSDFAQGSHTAGKPFLPQFGANYKLDKRSEIFGDAAYNVRTYIAGGYGYGASPWNTTQAGYDYIKNSLKPETSWTEEIGYRLTSSLAAAQASYYHVNFSNRLLAFAQGCSTCGAYSLLGNAGGVTTNGFDAAATVQLGSIVSLYNAFTWTSSTYDDNVQTYDSSSNSYETVNLKGKTNVDTPKLLYKTGLDVHKAGGFAHLGADYMSKRYYTFSNDNSVPDRFLVELGGGYKRANLGAFTDLKAQINISNLMDTKYWASMGTNNFPNNDPQGLDNTLQVGAPRAVSGTLSVRF